MSVVAISVECTLTYTRRRSGSLKEGHFLNELAEVGDKNVMKPEFDRSCKWVCNGVSAQCERNTRVDGENRYLGVKWTNS